MNKIKHPLVKKLRKAGYSTKEAMSITKVALDNLNVSKMSLRFVRCTTDISAWFPWSNSPEGRDYWLTIHNKLNPQPQLA